MTGAPLSTRAALELALSLQRQGRLDDAAALYLGVLQVEPRDFNALHMLGVVRFRQQRPGEAIALYDRALAASPPVPVEVLLNRSAAQLVLERLDEALADCERALAIDPDHPGARYRASLVHLSAGRFDAAWPQHEGRLGRVDFAGLAPPPGVPRWNGEPLAGRRLLVRAEQGAGDTLLFARFLARAEARGARLLLDVQPPLRALLAASFPQATLVKEGEAVSCDAYLPFLSLPFALGPGDAAVGASFPYLVAPHERRSRWHERLRGAGRPRIGFAWAGAASQSNDAYRSMPREVASRLPTGGASWFSLQVGREPLAPDCPIEVLGDELADFADTAAAMMELDLVVTVDTSVAHLAAALGRPTWVLLSRGAAWQWMFGRADSPWYPGVRLFRQRVPGNWDAVVDDVRRALRDAGLDQVSPPGLEA